MKNNILRKAGVARQLAAGATTSNTTLTATTSAVSLFANGADIRFVIGIGAQTASSTSHFITQGERLDFAVDPGSSIAVMRDSTTSGVLELIELI